VDTEVAKQRLEATLTELDRLAAELTDEQDPQNRPDTSDQDTGDAAIQLDSIDREQASLEVIAAQRERVEGALQRIADGTYGRCIDCGRELTDDRLEARPEAARCVDDQRKAEAAGTA
jgi:RNA polymerase-binding transcription factor DksA